MFLFAACCDKLFSDARDPANEGLIYSSGMPESDSREFIAIQRRRSAVSAHRTLETTSETSSGMNSHQPSAGSGIKRVEALFGRGIRFGLAMSAFIRQLHVFCLRLMLALPLGLGLGLWTMRKIRGQRGRQLSY